MRVVGGRQAGGQSKRLKECLSDILSPSVPRFNIL